MGSERKKKRALTEKQMSVLDELFWGDCDEGAALKKFGVKRRIYERWLQDERFSEEFNRRLEAAHRQGQLIIAKYCCVAAVKLVELTESAKEETARRACKDIITMRKTEIKGEPAAAEKTAEEETVSGYSPETAGRLLAILAEEKKD